MFFPEGRTQNVTKPFLIIRKGKGKYDKFEGWNLVPPELGALMSQLYDSHGETRNKHRILCDNVL
jgi:hypothetical protein